MPRPASSKQPAVLAKLTRPRLHAALSRGRLLALLDARRSHPVIWVAGPPGAGKATLVASYLEGRNVAGIWYQVDSGDGDPATFFHYLWQRLPGADDRDRGAG